MKSKSNEDYELEKEGSNHSEDINLDTKDPKCKNKVHSMTKLKVNMERLKQPPLKKDFAYFMKIGLSGVRTNPHRLKAGRDVAQKKLVETFNKVIFHLGFWYTKFWDLVLKVKVEKTWPLCYGKATMPYLKFITKEFTLRIVIKKIGKPNQLGGFC